MADEICSDANAPDARDVFEEGAGVDRARLEHLVQKAEQLCSNLLAMQTSHPDEKTNCVKQLIDTIYSLHNSISPFEELYKDFLKKRGIGRSKSDNPYHSTARAVMEQFGAKKVRSLCTHYAQACLVLKLENVGEGDVVQWLNEPLKTEKSRRGLTGIGKTKHLWSLTPDGMKQRAKKFSTKLVDAEKLLTNTIESCNGRIEESMFAADDTDVVEGAKGVALVEVSGGSVTILNLLTTDALKAAAAIRACLKEGNESGAEAV